jgi:hypothetical protein
VEHPRSALGAHHGCWAAGRIGNRPRPRGLDRGGRHSPVVDFLLLAGMSGDASTEALLKSCTRLSLASFAIRSESANSGSGTLEGLA